VTVPAILFCEDDPGIRKLIRVALRGTSYALLFAADGVEGLALARRERPAAIFTDLAMPNLDGYGLCAAVRADPLLCATPVIVLTASVQRSQLTAAGEHGATAVMLKPFTMEELREAVQRWGEPGGASRPPGVAAD
jgi:twitching motility two-component system response regulator PilG